LRRGVRVALLDGAEDVGDVVHEWTLGGTAFEVGVFAR
jgi:hypothetical protein